MTGRERAVVAGLWAAAAGFVAFGLWAWSKILGWP